MHLLLVGDVGEGCRVDGGSLGGLRVREGGRAQSRQYEALIQGRLPEQVAPEEDLRPALRQLIPAPHHSNCAWP